MNEDCKHTSVLPMFDEEAAKGLRTEEIRKRWPRFFGVCPECKESLIAYASQAHYVYGDW